MSNEITDPKSDNETTNKRKRTENVLSSKEDEAFDKTFGNKNDFLKNLETTASIGRSFRQSTNEIDAEPDRQPVWEDSGDEIDDDDRQNPRNKTGKYREHLKRQYNAMLGTPIWAKLERETEPDSDEEILQSVGHIIRNPTSVLLPTKLHYKRMKDLNRSTYGEGPTITGVHCHPTSTVALVTGINGLATIYSIDGYKNEKLHSVAFENYPIHCSAINKSGTEAIIGGVRNFFYTYNLMSGDTQRIFVPKPITKLKKFVVSPCGRLIAVIGRFGEVHVLDGYTKERIISFQQQHPCTDLSFNHDSSKLFAHSCDTEVSIYDLRSEKLYHRFVDDGCVNGSCITIAGNGTILAAGSEQGAVNIYSYKDVVTESTPKPLKIILNLTTSITDLHFNHTAEMLGMCSNQIPDSFKMVHCGTGTVFSNFPGNEPKMGKPNCFTFSPQSGYLAIGNLKKEAKLYRLKHYNNY